MKKTRNSQALTLAKSKKTQPFGAHVATRLSGVNNKLVCALGCTSSCWDDEEDQQLELGAQ